MAPSELDPPAPPPPPPRPVARRTLCLILQPLTFLITLALGVVATRFQKVFDAMEGLELPFPTQAILAFSRCMIHPAGIAVSALLVISLCVAVARGMLDRVLNKLIAFNVLWAVGYPGFATLSVFLPVINIQRALESS